MGVCYTYLLYDDFDWRYLNTTKDQVIEDIKKELPVATILGQWYNYIVLDLDKISPWGDNVQKLSKYCDSAKYYSDNSSYDIKDVEFKKDDVKNVRSSTN